MLYMTLDSLTIVGLARDLERSIAKNLQIIVSAFSDYRIEKIIIVESDSSDNTIKELENLRSVYSNLIYISKGELANTIPHRINRIRYCRNIYVEEIRKLNLESSYIVVADLDGINSKLRRKSIKKCFQNLEWDAIFPNQLLGYYDILALRHEFWSSSNCMEELSWRQSLIITDQNRFWLARRILTFYEFDKARKLSIYSKMIKLNKKLPRIRVQSAFGGIGIYKKDIFINYDYSTEAEPNGCEHVDLHLKMYDANMRLYIEPSFINSYINTYNINRFMLIRILRQIIWSSGFLYGLQKKLKNLLRSR